MCSPSEFVVEIGVDCLNKAPCPIPNGMLPGNIVEVHAYVTNLGQKCTCATVSFSANGVEFARKELCVPYRSGYENGVFYVYYWEVFGMLEAIAQYTVGSPGTYNFCAEVVSVR